MNVSVLIGSRYRLDGLKACVKSVMDTADNPGMIEIIVRIDDDDTILQEGVPALLAEGPNRFALTGPRQGYHGEAARLWQMCQIAQGAWLWHLNDDVVIGERSKGWDSQLMRIDRTKHVALPEWSSLNSSDYRHDDRHPFPIVANNWWKAFEVTQFFSPTDISIPEFLYAKGFQRKFIKGCVVQHNWDETDRLKTENRERGI